MLFFAVFLCKFNNIFLFKTDNTFDFKEKMTVNHFIAKK